MCDASVLQMPERPAAEEVAERIRSRLTPEEEQGLALDMKMLRRWTATREELAEEQELQANLVRGPLPTHAARAARVAARSSAAEQASAHAAVGPTARPREAALWTGGWGVGEARLSARWERGVLALPSTGVSRVAKDRRGARSGGGAARGAVRWRRASFAGGGSGRFERSHADPEAACGGREVCAAASTCCSIPAAARQRRRWQSRER